MNVFSPIQMEDPLLIREQMEQLQENLEICEIYLEEISVKRLLELGIMKFEQVQSIQKKYDLLYQDYLALKEQLYLAECKV